MLKREIDSLILNFGDPQILRKSKKKKKKKQKKKVRLKCCVLCKIGFIKIKPLKLANECHVFICLFRLIIQNGFCQTFTIRDMGQPLHPAGLVTFTCHLPRDKFCKKYLSDPEQLTAAEIKWGKRCFLLKLTNTISLHLSRNLIVTKIQDAGSK